MISTGDVEFAAEGMGCAAYDARLYRLSRVLKIIEESEERVRKK